MSWTSPDDLRAQLNRLWIGGELLAALAAGTEMFPRRLKLKGPTSAEMAGRFADVRAWIAHLRAMPQVRIEMREFSHRVLGNNAVPEEAWVDTLDQALTILGKQQEANRFRRLVSVTQQAQPALVAWLARRPLQALGLWREWPLLLDVVTWLQAHPRPGIYLRQMDLPGVHSKFVEAHRAVLSELLEIALPPGAIDRSVSGVSRFAQRHGFLDKPLRIRFRMLDQACRLLAEGSREDVTLDAESFALLKPRVSKVFITENEVNFLAFPPVAGSLVVFGAGYGFDVLAQADWLADCRVFYWGDIDTHGFAILDQLRNRFSHVESFLMDRLTLMAFEPLWGEEAQQVIRDLPRLGPEEAMLYDDLRDNRLQRNLRLEQERVGFAWVEAAISRIDGQAL